MAVADKDKDRISGPRATRGRIISRLVCDVMHALTLERLFDQPSTSRREALNVWPLDHYHQPRIEENAIYTQYLP